MRALAERLQADLALHEGESDAALAHLQRARERLADAWLPQHAARLKAFRQASGPT